jgi:hypothetical protein
MSFRYSSQGELMDESQKYARFANHLNTKKAGALVCPICKATESFEVKSTIGSSPPDSHTSTDIPPPTDPLASTDPQFDYAACTNCGYSIFFDTGISE